MPEEKFDIGDVVEARDKSGGFFKAKVINVEKRKTSGSRAKTLQYLVHFDGWNKRFDTWLQPSDLQKCVGSKKRKQAADSTRGSTTAPSKKSKRVVKVETSAADSRQYKPKARVSDVF
eukprot:SAG11_NODE_2030_length_3899_cov_6.833772_2_plen_118_part_00